jgi:hypothetical protein
MTNSTRSSRPGAMHRALVGLVAAASVTAALTTVTAELAAASTRYAGYPIKSTRYADSSWIGARGLGDGIKAYRFDPRKRNIDSAYRAAHLVSDLGGTKSGPTARRTARGAYVLSVYGARRDKIQAAGVDASVYHLLKGGAWLIGNSRGSKRIKQSGANRAYVRSYAKTMIADSAKYAGPYRRSLTATDTTAGSATKVAFTIKSAKGYGMANLHVKFGYPGADPVTVYTDRHGQAIAYFTPQTAGSSTVNAAVAQVPEWRLVVRDPKRVRASRLAVAGVTRTLMSAATVTSTGAQAVSVANAKSSILTGQALGGTYTVAGGTGSRTVSSSVYGPFDDTATSCTSTPAFSSDSTIDADGTYPLPPYAPTKSGYYRWGILAAANPYSTEASACGPNVRVRKQAAIGQLRPDGRPVQVKVGQAFDLTVRISGFDRAETHTVTSILYGPYTSKDNVTCADSRRVSGHDQTRQVTGNGDFNMPNTVINSNANVGWYGWKSMLASGELILGDTSNCGVLYQVVK